MKQHNELLRSALQIARRGGKDTNWKAFERNVESQLLRDANASADPHQRHRSTHTPRTYQLPSCSCAQSWSMGECLSKSYKYVAAYKVDGEESWHFAGEHHDLQVLQDLIGELWGNEAGIEIRYMEVETTRRLITIAPAGSE